MAGINKTNAIPTCQSDFQNLITQAILGNTAARNTLFQQLRPYLLIVAINELDEQLHAKLGPSDIVQQSMMRAVQELPQYRGSTDAEFKGWLRQILINEARLARRVFATEKRDVQRERGLDNLSTSDRSLEPRDIGLTPATRALAEEQSAAVQRLIAQLPENHQIVIRLRNWEDLTFEEIAKRMGMSVSGVAKIWYRALVGIQQLYLRENDSRLDRPR
jgi:RNA polymerase sigma-70 factor (ECF subfamily)